MIHTAQLFPELGNHLIELLRSFSDDEWWRPTVCSKWCVKDIASHLLDGDLRRLSMQRDGFTSPDATADLGTYESLVAFLNELNAQWTIATRRLSPRLLTELLAWTHPQVAALFAKLDPHARGLFSVAWAGEAESSNGFDIAREYTERWHHQRQIIDAVGKPSLIDSRKLYHSVLETFLRALPHTYKTVTAAAGTIVQVTVTGEAGGNWLLKRTSSQWELTPAKAGTPNTIVAIPQDVAWRVFTKRLPAESALARYPGITIQGDRQLGLPVLNTVSIMA